MANPSGNQQEQQQGFFNGANGGSSSNPSNVVNGNSGPHHDNSVVVTGIKHNPGISTDWTAEESAILEEGLTKYASEINVVRYAKIALKLPNKTVRDIALRIRWLNKKEVSKRRKEDHRKSKDKREKVTENTSKPAHMSSRPSGHPYSTPAVPLDNEDGISYEAIGGNTAELLKQNHQFFQQICTNFSCFQIQDNISLLCQARENIAQIMSSISDTPDIMKQMPPLPVKLNEELVNAILPPTSHQMQS